MRELGVFLALLLSLSLLVDAQSQQVSDETWINDGNDDDDRLFTDISVILEVHDHSAETQAADLAQLFKRELSNEIESLYRQRGYNVNFVVGSLHPIHTYSTGAVSVRVIGNLRLETGNRNAAAVFGPLEAAAVSGSLGRFTLNPHIRMSQVPSTDSSRCADPVTEFACDNDGPAECFKLLRLCDGVHHCSNGVDESNCRQTAPLLRLISSLPKAEYTVGDNVTLYCFVAHSYTDVRFSWILPAGKAHDSVYVRKSARESSLTTTILSAGDAGEYRCEATNRRGTSTASSVIRVHVSTTQASRRSGDQRPGRLRLVRTGGLAAAPAPVATCADNMFQCSNGQCIDKKWRCDARVDCDDGSDEMPCALLPVAEFDQFACNRTNEFIPKTWVCDGDADCSDKSDEQNCNETTASCVYQCDGKCVSRGRICDYDTQVIMMEKGCVAKIDELECSLPKIESISPAVVQVPYQNSLTLYCKAVGYPPPTIVWSLNNSHLPSRLRTVDRTDYQFNLQERQRSYSLGSVTINPANPSDNGHYRCVASNARGSVTSDPVAVTVEACSSSCTGGMVYNSVARNQGECLECFCSGRSSQCSSSRFPTKWEALDVSSSMVPFVSTRPSGNVYYYPRKFRNSGTPTYPEALVRFPQPDRSANAQQLVQLSDGTLWINSTDLSEFGLLKLADVSQLFTSMYLSYGAVIEYEFFVGLPDPVESTESVAITSEIGLLRKQNHKLVNDEYYVDEPEPRRTYRFGDLTLTFANVAPVDFYVNGTLRANRWNKVSFTLTERASLQAYHEMVESSDHFVDNTHAVWWSQDELSSARVNRSRRIDYMMDIEQLQSVFIRAKYSPSQTAFGLRNIRVLKPDSNSTLTVCRTDQTAWQVEKCVCPIGYEGSSCELCSSGFNRVFNPNTQSFECTQCNCNNHSSSCDPKTGQCFNCWHNTDGKQCEQCAVGFYRNKNVPLTSQDTCNMPCDCGFLNKNRQDRFLVPCELDGNNQVVCKNCPRNMQGSQCGTCATSYQADTGTCFNAADKCSPFSRSVDDACCACLNNTTGVKCEYCKPGYFGYELMKTERKVFPECQKCFCFNRSNSCVDNKDNLYWQKFSWNAPSKCNEDTHYRHWRYLRLSANHSWNEKIEWRNVPSVNVLTSYTNKNFVDLVVAETAEQKMIAPNNWTKFLSAGLAPAYCIVPRCWLGDFVTSYGGNLSARVYYQAHRPWKSPFKRFPEFVITGAQGVQLAHYSGSLMPSSSMYSVRLLEHYWSVVGSNGTRRPSRVEFLQVLAQVKDIYIKCLHVVNKDQNLPVSSGLVSYEYEYASAAVSDRRAATVEQCYCPTGYAGTSCEKCADGYYAKNPEAGDVCRLCSCNGRADRCTADGVCTNCKNNTGGANCERCADGYWGDPSSAEGCKPCTCYGSYGYPLKCSNTPDGRNYTCDCPPSATGSRCEECKPGYSREDMLDLSAPCNKPGAQRCGCSRDGTVEGQRWTCKIPACTGGPAQCACKPLAVGNKCDRCVNDSYINLDYRNPLGCDACYCSFRSSVCNASSTMRNYGLSEVTPRYSEMKPTSECENCDKDAQFKLLAFSSDGTEQLRAGVIRIVKNGEVIGDVNATKLRPYWKLPAVFNQAGVNMYSLTLSYSIEFSKLPANGASSAGGVLPDVMIRSNGRQIVYTYANPPKVSGTRYDYSISIDEKSFDKYDLVDPQWYTLNEAQLASVRRVKQSRVDVLKVLSYATGIYIRASYMDNEAASSTIRNVRLQVVEHSENARLPVGSKAVEVCPCPTGYEGLSCEKCTKGYRYTPGVREEYPRTCVPCQCHNHTDTCDPETGECIDCMHNTEGYKCEACQPGYIRLVNDPFHRCQPCKCPGIREEGKHFASGGCNVDPTDQTKYSCVCDVGYAGDYCEKCADGYEGDPVNGQSCVPITVAIDYNYIFATIMSTSSFSCWVTPASASLTSKMTWTRVSGGSMDEQKSAIDAATNNTWTSITFSQIDPLLAGSYNCCAYQNSWSTCQTGMMNVSAPPKLSAVLVPNITRCAVEQEDVEFVCRSDPDISYVHYDFISPLEGQSNVQILNKNRLVVANSNRSQNSTVMCRIHPSWVAEEGQAAESNSANFCVLAPYVDLVVQPPNPIDEDTDVTLECRLHPWGVAVARKPLEILNIHTLEKETDTVQVRNNSYILVVFPKVTKMQYDGQYRCVADYGKYSPVLLKDEELVDITQNIPVVRLDLPPWRIEGQDLDFKCDLTGAPIKFFSFSIYRSVDGGDPQLIVESDTHKITNVRADDSGSYFCKALRVDDATDEGVESPRNRTTIYIPHVNIAPPERIVGPGKGGMFECALKPHVIVADEPMRFVRADGQALRDKSFVFTNTTYGNLTITDANTFDASNYVCSAKWNGRTLTASSKLSLAIPTDFRVLISTSTPAPVYGQQLVFTCVTSPETDKEDTIYTFRFNNREQLPAGTRVGVDRITIENAQPDLHNGGYSCCASVEGLSPHCSDMLFITVQAEAPSVVVRPTIAVKAFNQSVTFACQYRGIPTPVVQWVSISSDRRPIYDDTTKQMIFTQVSMNNIGQYQCNATNTMGTASAVAWLYGYESAEAQKIYGGAWKVESGIPGSTLTLTCYAGPEKTATLWRYNGREIATNDPAYLIDHDLSTLTIRTLSESIAGEYTCISVGSNGRILGGRHMFVAAFRQPSPLVTQMVTGVVGLSYNLTCPATAELRSKTYIVLWSRIDKLGAKISVTNETEGVRIVGNTVVFDKLLSDDSTHYICEATSIGAQESYQLQLNVGNLVPQFKADTLMVYPSASRYDVFETTKIDLAIYYVGDGGIVYNDNEPRTPDTFAIGIQNAHLEFVLNTGNAEGQYRVASDITLTPNNWYRVKILRYRGNITLTVNSSTVQRTFETYDTTALDLGGKLYFGAYLEGLQRVGYESSFQGVISWFAINDRVLRFGQEYLSVQNVASFNACASGTPLCRTEVGSTCVADYSPLGYRCVCPNQYGGDYCEHIGAKCGRSRCGVFGRCLSKKRPNEESEEEVQCICPLGVTGSHCEYGVPLSSPVFTKYSYVEYAAAQPTRENELTLDILFLPLERDDSATVFYQASGQSYLALIISDSNVEFLFVEARGSFLSITGRPLSESETLVRVSITPTKLQMFINGEALPAIPNTKPALLSRISGSFVLGYADNAPDDPLLPREAFEGEITQVRINEVPLELAYPIISSRNITDGSRSGLCHPSACNNHGQCTPNGGCSCNRQYEAETNCATKTDESVCDVLPQCECNNGGTCEQNGDWFLCSCPPGFIGDRCEILSVAYSTHIKDAYLTLPSEYNTKRKDGESIQFTFKYDKPTSKVVNGMLAVYGNPSETSHFIYFGLLVLRGKVQLHIGYRFGEGVKFEFTSKTAKGHNFKDKYAISMQRQGRQLNITENGVSLFSGEMTFEDDANPTNLNLDVSRGWYLIGMPELGAQDKRVNDVGFDTSLPSCISDFIVDGSKVDFMPLKGTETQMAPGGTLTLNCNLAV